MRLSAAHETGIAWRGPLLFVAAVALAVALLALDAVRTRLATPVHVGDTPLALEVSPGTPFGRLAGQLADAGGYPYPRFLSLYARWQGSAQSVQAGEYEIAPGTSVDAFLDQLVRGDVVQYSITVIEGWTFRQFVDALVRHPKLQHVIGDDGDEAIMASLGRPGEHPEGRFFPDTYAFTRGTTDLDILRRAYGEMAERLDAVWAARADDLPLESAYDALIMASIIEKETGRPDERGRISGVFARRLQRGMRLQTDPTVIYGMGERYDGNITRRDLRTDTPYNTYTRAGLPPTPIALPGQGALEAAVDPVAGESLYFVATGEPDGSHYFSATLAEHERAVARYLERLRRRE